MNEKNFRIKRNQLKRVMDTTKGSGIASDEIMVTGKPVGRMERIAIDNHPEFSGWTFLSGEETQEFVDNPLNSDTYNLNTIANYDARIIPFLDEPVGTIVDFTSGNPEILKGE